MYRITKTNPRVFAEEKFDDGYRGFSIAPEETREEAPIGSLTCQAS